MREHRRIGLKKMAERYIVKRLDYHIKNQINLDEVTSDNNVPGLKFEGDRRQNKFDIFNPMKVKIED
jgi:hypothetical protein